MLTNEEFERKMAFIVEQQAQFASDIQRLRESQAQTDEIVAQAGEKLAQTGEIVTRLANVTLEGFKDVNAKINALVDSQIRTEEGLRLTDEGLRLTGEVLRRTDEHLRRTDENVRRTDENVRRTDESLRNLIAVVDRHLSDGHSGASSS